MKLKLNLIENIPFTLLIIWLIGAAILILWSISLSDGYLIYTLDDPYIHLAVAESIVHGGYGINIEEYSSPSSSIIWPFMLAITEWIGLGDFGPLVLNLLAMGCAVYVASHIIQNYVLKNNQGSKIDCSSIFTIILGLSLFWNMNAWGLVMTGMEHSLHVLAITLVILGFLKVIDDGSKLPAWIILVIVALPLIRFEGLAMASFSVIALFYLGHRRSACFAAFLVLLSLVSWFLFMKSLGLPALPSSVLMKSGIASNLDAHSGAFSVFQSILSNGLHSIKNVTQGRLLAIASVLTLILAYRTWIKGHRKIGFVLGGLAISTGLAHILCGQFGWFSRYQVYALTTVYILCLVLGRNYLKYKTVRIGLISALLVFSTPYVTDTLRTPIASRNIYQQQFQMHNFVVNYWKRPVAVNDLGWVSYKNPFFVLDLWGLGSVDVCRMKLALGGMNAEALNRIVLQRQVSLIMVYDSWFMGVIPSSWSRVAFLNTSLVTSGSSTVSFYVTPGANRKEIVGLLRQFSLTLPLGATLSINP
jgi:hypothetical protein